MAPAPSPIRSSPTSESKRSRSRARRTDPAGSSLMWRHASSTRSIRPGIMGPMGMRRLGLLAVCALLVVGTGAHAPRALAAAPQALFHKQRVAFKSGALTLTGYVYKPDGDGPFPTLLWNHGSEPDPGGVPQF